MKICNLCGRRMVVRERIRDQRPFWGCSAFSAHPSCRGTQSMSNEERWEWMQEQEHADGLALTTHQYPGDSQGAAWTFALTGEYPPGYDRD